MWVWYFLNHIAWLREPLFAHSQEVGAKQWHVPTATLQPAREMRQGSQQVGILKNLLCLWVQVWVFWGGGESLRHEVGFCPKEAAVSWLVVFKRAGTTGERG